MAKSLIQMATVTSVDDELSAGRIKVKMIGDKSEVNAFPLLPKMFQSAPKVNECVIIITAELDNTNSNRYYIGPVISQPQDMEHASYAHGLGNATSVLINGGSPHGGLVKYDLTDGAFPSQNEVAVIGRKGEDIRLKEGEVVIASGIRQKIFTDDANLKGNVCFNSATPALIQLKSDNSVGNDSLINVIANKIYFTNNESGKEVTKTLTSKQKEGEVKKEDAHPIAKGDILADLLYLLRDAIMMHKHIKYKNPPYSKGDDGQPVDALNDRFNELMNKLLSDTVYTS